MIRNPQELSTNKQIPDNFAGDKVGKVTDQEELISLLNESEASKKLSEAFRGLQKEAKLYQEKYQEYVKKRSNTQKNKTIYPLEEILSNQLLISDDRRKKDIVDIVKKLELSKKDEVKVIDTCREYHLQHTQEGLGPFDLADYPDRLKHELNGLRELCASKVEQHKVDEVYRELVDSGLLGSIERNERIKKRIEKFKQVEHYIGQIPSIAIFLIIGITLWREGMDIQNIYDLGSTKFWQRHINLSVYKGLFILAAVGKISNELVYKFIKSQENKSKKLDTHIEKVQYIVSELKDNKEIPLFLSSFELIDELFTDEEVEELYERFYEKSNNRTDINKLESALENENIPLYKNSNISNAIKNLHEKINNVEKDYKVMASKRLKNLSSESLYTILCDILDNMNHIENGTIERKQLLSEIERTIDKPNTIEKIRKKLYESGLV